MNPMLMKQVLSRVPMDEWQRMSKNSRRRFLNDLLRTGCFAANDVFPPGGIAADTNRGFSPAIWGRLPRGNECVGDPTIGQFYFDDFRDFPLIGTQTTEIAHGKYKVYNTGAGVIARKMAVNSVTIQGGAIENSLDTDNDSGSLAQSYQSVWLNGLAATSGPMALECCYTQNAIATNMAAGFVGLAETSLFTLAATVPFNAGDPINNSGSMIGFRLAEDGLGVVDTVISDRATSFTNIGATEAGTIAAYTFKKFGMFYNPNDKDRCIRFFSDGVELATAISRSTLIGYTNLDANLLGLLWSNCADTAGTSFKSYLKWWSFLQMFA